MKRSFVNRIGWWKSITLVFTFFIGLQSLDAQEINVTGKVTDSGAQGLPGVNVVVKGTVQGTITDFDGNYSLQVPGAQSVLSFSFIGFTAVEEPVNGRSLINVTLQEESIGLDEVVAIGYGVTRKSDLTGALSSVGAEDFEKQPVYRIEDALQGRASGVQVTKNSGAAGADIKIRIRGSNSISGDNSPLVVIDGIIGGDLKSLNTNDIQTMEVLKDASATAIYGSRGANGVILVSTKKGSGKTQVDISHFTSLSEVHNFVDKLSPQEFSEIHDIPLTGEGYDYQEGYFRQGVANNTQVSVSGKEGKTGFFVSANAVDQKGIVINTNYKRYSLRTNLETKVNDKLSVGLNIYGSNESMLNLVSGGSRAATDTRGGVITVLGWDPTTPPRNADGSYNKSSSAGMTLINPIAVMEQADANTTIWSMNANLNVSYEFTKDLNFTVLAGVMNRNNVGENYRGIPDGTVLMNPTGAGAYSGSLNLQNSNILTWSKGLGLNNLKLTGIYEIQRSVNKGFNANGGEYVIPGNFYSLSLGSTPGVKANYRESAISSYIARGEYNFDRKIFVTATMRADESSRFRAGNRLGWFPSVSAAYQLDQYLENVPVLDRLKLRVGYGETGNQAIEPYSTYNSFEVGANYPLDGTTESPGIVLGNIGNPDLTWETTTQTNYGLDLALWEGRMTVSVDKYDKNTVDLLLDVPIPGYAGGGFVKRNVGEVSNKGWDFNLAGTVINTKKISWDSDFNFSTNKNKVISLAGEQSQLILEPAGLLTNVAGSGYSILEVGKPLGQFYGATFEGTYKTGDTDGTPGEPRYKKDEKGNLVFGVIGNGTPKTTWGFNNTLSYGNFDLNFLIRGAHGHDVFNLTRATISLPGGVIQHATHGDYRNRWTPENQTDIPAGGNKISNSSQYVEDGSFVKLSNLALGYNFNGIKGIRSLRIYVSAQNLFTISDYKGYDPEASSTSSSDDTGSSIDLGAFPNPRTFTFGINLGL